MYTKEEVLEALGALEREWGIEWLNDRAQAPRGISVEDWRMGRVDPIIWNQAHSARYRYWALLDELRYLKLEEYLRANRKR